MRVEDVTEKTLRLGLEVSFVPVAHMADMTDEPKANGNRRPKRTSGRVVYIHWAHRYYTVRAVTSAGGAYKESFKF